MKRLSYGMFPRRKDFTEAFEVITGKEQLFSIKECGDMEMRYTEAALWELVQEGKNVRSGLSGDVLFVLGWEWI